MPASTDLKRDNSAKAIAERLKGSVTIPPREKKTVEELPRWVKTALVRKIADGLTYKEAAALHSKASSTLAEYAKSPAAKAWMAPLLEFVEDPVAMAKAVIGANSLSVTLDRLLCLENAKEAGDWKLADSIAKDLQEKAGIVTKKQDSGAISVKISLGGAAGITSEAIDAEFELLESEGGEG